MNVNSSSDYLVIDLINYLSSYCFLEKFEIIWYWIDDISGYLVLDKWELFEFILRSLMFAS